MDANWSLVLNILLLLVVLFSIARLVKNRRESLNPSTGTSQSFQEEPRIIQDDIIAIRKVNTDVASVTEPESVEEVESAPNQRTAQPTMSSREIPAEEPEVAAPPQTLMMLLLARENRQFAGYELLQTILASGLRFGEGQLFHRHQFANGQGPILCSLAAATNSGLFDLQNIGAFSVRGLCLFMQASGNTKIDEERFTIMLDTARQLSEGLDALLLDDMRRPLTDQRISRYYQLLNLQNYS